MVRFLTASQFQYIMLYIKGAHKMQIALREWRYCDGA